MGFFVWPQGGCSWVASIYPPPLLGLLGREPCRHFRYRPANDRGYSAVGYCVTYDSASPPLGTCAFHAGSGTLAGFQAVVTVTVDDKQIWHWDGGYLLGAAK